MNWFYEQVSKVINEVYETIKEIMDDTKKEEHDHVWVFWRFTKNY